MDYHLKLPRNGKEFIVFLLILSVLSVLIIAPFITSLEMGFSLSTLRNAFGVMPFIWIAVVILVLLTHEPATKISNKILTQEDSFRAHMIVNCLVNVFMMSIALSIIAPWIGMRQINMIPIHNFLNLWPRNFAIAFFTELLIAQPIARYIMLKMHVKMDGNTALETK